MNYYNVKKKFKNPIIPGFYPDPSICRVGDDYYLVNSSFEYFPAIPVWHSKDLVHWEQICNAIDRKEQRLNIMSVDEPSKGIQACTIRYHDGIYYIISTRLNKIWPHYNNHFIITATSPNGPWSECHFIEGASGIDSSLFFDDDGKCYFHANRERANGRNGADTEIWCQEIDLNSFKLIGEAHALWTGCGGVFPEGPHIYKRNGYYYLMIAEGGTGHNHTVTMARSENIFGPYTSSPRNPLLTHKNLHVSYPITNVGHADIVETQNGEWFMVALGSRPKGGYMSVSGRNDIQVGYYRNMGRESFLIPMVWEDDYSPIVSPLTGRVEEEFITPSLASNPFKRLPNTIRFRNNRLDLRLVTVKNEALDFYQIKNNRLCLRLGAPIEEFDNASIIGCRQTAFNYSASCRCYFNPIPGDEGGICLFQNYKYHVKLNLANRENKMILELVNVINGSLKIINYIDLSSYRGDISEDGIVLSIDGNDEVASFYYSLDNDNPILLGSLNISHLACDVAGGHTGNLIMLYGASLNENSNSNIEFSYLEIDNF